MAYVIELSDTIETQSMPILNVPLEQATIEGATDVTTLDMNVYTDFFANKRLWSHTWSYMTEDEFNALKAFYDRQFILWKYPSLTITDLGIEDVIVRMTISPQRIIDNCGTVENVQVTFRETIQMSDDWQWSS